MPAKRTLIMLGAAIALTVLLLGLRAGTHRGPLDVLGRRDGIAQGYVDFPRGGPYIVGFDSGSGEARLFIDGHDVAHGQGVQKNRIVYEAGVHELRLEGEAELLWHPPGRRGPLERLPASSVSTSKDFGAGAGASRGDAAIASLLVLTWLAFALMLLRPRLDRQRALLYGGILVLALGARCSGVVSAGQTWDEDEYWCAGKNYVDNVLGLDFRDARWRDNFEHPPLTKYVAGVGALWQDGLTASKGLFVLLSALTCVLAAAITWRLFSPRAALFAGMATALTPHLIAHSRVVGHETPSTFFWALAVWLALRSRDGARPEDLRLSRLAWVGVAAGFAIATRYSNALMAPCLAVVFLVLTPRLKNLVAALLVPAATCAVTFFALWPRLWTQPFLHLHEAYAKITKMVHPPENFLGGQTNHPPWPYFIVYVLAATPVLLLALGLVTGPITGAMRRQRSWLIIGAWILAPLGMLWSPVRQDGVRYVLPILVPISIAAGVGLEAVISHFRHRAAGPVAAALLGLYLLVTNLRVAPYQLDYFNEAVGGPAHVQAKKWFEIGWWGEGIAEAVEVTNATAQPGAKLFKMLSPNHVNWFRADLFEHEVQNPAAADWIVVNDAGIFVNDVLLKAPPFKLPPDAVLVHDVQAQGASLARVYRRGEAR